MVKSKTIFRKINFESLSILIVLPREFVFRSFRSILTYFYTKLQLENNKKHSHCEQIYDFVTSKRFNENLTMIARQTSGACARGLVRSETAGAFVELATLFMSFVVVTVDSRRLAAAWVTATFDLIVNKVFFVRLVKHRFVLLIILYIILASCIYLCNYILFYNLFK